MSINPTNAPSNQGQTSSSYWSNTAPRYNNNDVFDGHYLLRRNNRSNNYSSYIEGDSYRAQHIPALMENGGNNSNTNASPYSTPQYSQQQQQQQWNQWNQYNAAAMYYQSVYQQQYYQNNTGFTPPLPKTAPPPPPPPR